MNSEEIIAEDHALENFFDKYILTFWGIAEAKYEAIKGQHPVFSTVSSPVN